VSVRITCGCEFMEFVRGDDWDIRVNWCPKHAAADEMLAALKKIAEEPFGPPEASATEVLRGIEECAKAAIAKAGEA
jgi:hypothetical protein